MSDSDPRHDSHKITVALNGLRWLQAEEDMRNLFGQDPNHENLLGFLRAPFAQPDFAEFVKRYRALTAHDTQLFAAPVHPRITRGILQPVHNAKAAYVLGHFPSCIGLCGVAAEMLAIFRFEVAEARIGDDPLDEVRQRHLWGATFETLKQSVRSSSLHALGLIDGESLDLFKRVSGIRNKYVHFLSRDVKHEEAEATQAYKATVELTTRILGIGVNGSQLTIHADVVRFLQREGPYGQDGKIAARSGSAQQSERDRTE